MHTAYITITYNHCLIVAAMSEQMMGTVAKAEPEDLSSLYDLEYKAKEDDAWYTVSIVLDANAQRLTVKYLCYPQVYEAVFSARGFEKEAQVDELVGRFRPVSSQLQDHECGQLSIGATVCAAHGTADYDLRFYDAVIEAVDHQAHSFVGGEEECLCTFVLFWLCGPNRGTLTSGNIASICTIEPVLQIDSRLSAFAILAKEKITCSKSISVCDSHASASIGPSLGKGNSCVSIKKSSESSQNRLQEMETNMMPKSLISESEDIGRNRNYNQWKSQDEDIGPEPCNIGALATSEGLHIILIDNLEKDLTPSSIKKFIYKQTTILPQAFVFPRLLSDPSGRGAIFVDCQKKVQIIYEFLNNPNHLIVSSRGRPWVIMEKEKALAGTFRTTIWDLIPMILDDIQDETTDKELDIVHSGTESYKRAKQLKDLFMEFIHHESCVCKKLVMEENRIWRSFQPA